MDYTDEDKDVKYLQLNSYYPSYESAPSFFSTYRIHQVDIDDSYRHPDPGFFGGDPGVWRLEFELEDECRHLSDKHAIWVNVISAPVLQRISNKKYGLE